MLTKLKDISSNPGSSLLPILGLFLFLASFFYQQNFGNGARFMPYTWTIWIAAVPILTVGVYLLASAEKIILPRYWPGLLGLPLVLLLAGLVADISRPVEWALRIGVVLGGFLFLFSLFQYRPSRRAIENLLFILAIASLGHAVVALVQMHGGVWWHGWLPQEDGKPIGIFQQINLVASFSATGLVVAIYLLTVPGYKSRSLFYKLVIYSTIAICAAVTLANGSRTGLFGALVAMSFLLAGRYRMLLQQKRRLALLVAALLAGLAYGFHLSDGMARMENKLERAGFEESRVMVYRLSWELFTEKPLFGHGIGSFARVFQEQRIPFQAQHPSPPGDAMMFTHPHNEPLFWLVESGLVSVLGMLAAVIVTIMQLLKLGSQRGLAYMGLLIPISLHVMVELPFYLSPIHWFTWLILLYLVHSHAVAAYPNRISPYARKAILAASLLLTLLLILFFVSTMQSLRDLRKFGASGDLGYLAKVNENPVLHETGAMFTLRTLLYTDVGTGGDANTRRFIDWAENYLRDVPNPLVMADLALAYSYIGDQANAERVIDRSVSIYNTSFLLEYQQQVKAGTLVEYFRRQILKQ